MSPHRRGKIHDIEGKLPFKESLIQMGNLLVIRRTLGTEFLYLDTLEQRGKFLFIESLIQKGKFLFFESKIHRGKFLFSEHLKQKGKFLL